MLFFSALHPVTKHNRNSRQKAVLFISMFFIGFGLITVYLHQGYNARSKTKQKCKHKQDKPGHLKAYEQDLCLNRSSVLENYNQNQQGDYSQYNDFYIGLFHFITAYSGFSL
jgi:hypothetical protein